MKTMIELKSMKFYAYHGVSMQEKTVGNNFVVDLSYSFPMDKAFESDDLNDTINYADVYNVIKLEMERPSNLIEHVTERISNALKSEFPQITYLKIKLSKLNPPIEGEIYSASIMIEKSW
jgi:dihydroneopterin aldolase